MPAIARVGDPHAGTCSHGLLCCPHNVTGTLSGGSANANANGRSIARMGDAVIHNCPHCGTGNIASASGTVSADGRGVARAGDRITYPGGSGTITAGSGNVNAR